jgi:polar amino acid transport system substrate-binding protein
MIVYNIIRGNSADNKPYQDKNDDVSEGKLIMATNAEFPPYEFFIDGVIYGIDVDIMNAVCDELNIELFIDNMGFDSILEAVSSGKADVGAAGISMTPERAEIVGIYTGLCALDTGNNHKKRLINSQAART